jgi:hypothetical protein
LQRKQYKSCKNNAVKYAYAAGREKVQKEKTAKKPKRPEGLPKTTIYIGLFS